MGATHDSAAWARVLEAAVAHVFDSVMVTDAESRIVHTNAAFTELTGYTLAEVEGHTPRFLQGPATDREVIARLERTIADGGVFEGSTVNYRKDGTAFDIAWRVVPVRDDAGALSHYVTVQRDVSASKTG
ncbi:PAS domain S-box-containing protein [Limimonas halophila]|uniref:PAS domain S-box-containing protein n=1 Tax=Limimonas halophila TaxID=1082479 RepID=A0A1G7QUK5_9PROT|nr:PAS domain S-box protein [Limimonas halophila]SDG02206.1 PAS domain S-box-containing protein [Limimonas halophila]